MCGVYVCLSYTWGLQNTCVTTPDSLQSNLANIPYDQLPQTYKDAVTVALALNFPFLWIDSLCVIQGDEDSVDWKEQSSQMADIYGNAELCLDEGYRCECAFSAAVSSLGLVTIKELYEPRLELGGPYETPNWMWQSTVEHYTRRRLTALSSVARVAQLALRTRYVTGHWWDADFLCSLCWAPVCTEETERTFSADCYVAPSWSWAAHNGPVTMWILVVPATRDDDVGAVSSGRITVRRVFLGVAVDTKPREQPLGVMMRKREAITFSFDRPLGLTSAADKYFCWVACVLPGQASRRRKSDTYCLIVLRGKPEGLEHVCERVGFVDHEAVTNSTCMRFFEGYRKLYRIAVIV
ncbi:hypothetical protein CH35J_001983 [Colletotrichum higginsianum]|uniref:Heterokaryon incompatibility domain-containing protein n=1 Tax=Colletotrichum higginsianum TaxID=80884 RepID=A0A4V4NDF1_9PEZI|nr:hypothetical protein CH35J_001983 [Colletotrichum higginsianum]